MIFMGFLAVDGLAAMYELYGKKEWIKKIAWGVIFVSSFAALYSIGGLM